MPLLIQYFTSQILLTSTNIKKVNKVEGLISFCRNQTPDLPKPTIIHKTLKIARRIIADKIILNYIHIELLTANMQKKQQAQYTGL